MRIALIYGGNSPEYEVSLKSAANIRSVLHSLGHQVTDIHISRDNVFTHDGSVLMFDMNRGFIEKGGLLEFDCAFIACHGAFGEDGRLQGMLDFAGIRYTGPDFHMSSLGMKKSYFTAVCHDAGIPVVETMSVDRGYDESILTEAIGRFGRDLVIKSETTGSSRGVFTVDDANEDRMRKAIELAQGFSSRVLIQRNFRRRTEIEVAVMKDRAGRIYVSKPGRLSGYQSDSIISYDNKYDEKNHISLTIIENDEARRLAEKIYRNAGCTSFVRIDFFLEDGRLYLNEINTIPGLTGASHFPVLMQSIGIDQKTFVRISIEEALYRE